MVIRNILIGLGIIFIAIVAVFFIFGTRATIKNYPPKDGPIIAFGDSLVSGSGSTRGNDFVSILSRKIGEPIYNLGVPGDTTEEAMARVDDAALKKPSIVILLLGGNDFLGRVPRATTFINLETIIGKFQAQGAVVLLLGVRAGLIFNEVGLDFNRLAADTGSAYVPDVLDGLFGDTRYMSDEVHPNDAGYALIAAKVYPVLKNLLR